MKGAAPPPGSVSIVIPAFNEEESVAATVVDFLSSPLVREVLVVDNSSTDRTVQMSREAGARVETVHCAGYGDTIATGLDLATGEILVVTEADHSFRSLDLDALVSELARADLVLGTRTRGRGRADQSAMRGVPRFANKAMAGLVGAMWLGSRVRFTDVGCTFRALRADSWVKMRPWVSSTGPEFSPEMMVAALHIGLSATEVPVAYHHRAGGSSSFSGNYRALSRTALRMLRLVIMRRFGLWPSPTRPIQRP